MLISDIIQIVVEIGLLFAFFYFALTQLQGTRGVGIFRGVMVGFIIIFIIGGFIADKLNLTNIYYIWRNWGNGLLIFMIVALVIIFQPELRRILMDVGKGRFFGLFAKSKSSAIDEIVDASYKLSESRYGALIAIEREIGLKPYIEGGTYIDADVSNELLQTIFYPGSALHDGGVVIKDERVIAAGCVFPLTENPNIDKSHGTRHRAGIGLTEESDAIVLVVSEETGNVSLCLNGQLKTGMDRETMKKTMHDIYMRK